MANYLVSFRPLCSTRHGREAVRRFAYPPFIDGSCRREPDLQSELPSISSLCRGDKFAPRLRLNDRLLYMTVKGSYGGTRGRAIVAALKVVKVLNNHKAATAWYRRRNLRVPSNCMIPGNQPLSVERTVGLPKDPGKPWKQWSMTVYSPPSLRSWDKTYRDRARRVPAFVVTKPVRPLGLVSPKVLSDTLLCSALQTSRVPGTQNYKLITDMQFMALCQFL